VTVLPTSSTAETVAMVRRLLRPHRLLAALAATLFVAEALVGLVAPAAIGRIVNLVQAGDGSALTWPIVIVVVAALAEGAFAWAGPAVGAQAVEPALADLRELVVDRALATPSDDVERAGTGDLVARVDGDVASVSEGVRESFPVVLQSGLTIVLTVVGMAVLDWRLGLAALCALPIQLWTVRWYLPRSRPLYAAERAAAGARSQQLLETVGSAPTVRALGLGQHHHRLVAERSEQAVGLVVSATHLRTRFFARLNLAELVGLSAVLATGFVLVGNGQVTVGAVTAAALYFQRLFDPINGLLYLLDEAQSAGAALARLVGVAGRPPAADPMAVVESAAVEVADVTFAYEAGHPVLHDLSLRVEPGERVAVVGATGAGKSTLAKLIAGVHTAEQGSVTLGGAAAGAVRFVNGQVPVALLSQEAHVFAGTIADDLRLAAPGTADGALHDSLERVGAEAWVHALPQGLATVVGDGGHRLTGVQAQQLALARVVLLDPALVVLDEATAEGGSVGARILEGSAAAALEGRTAVVVAHRLTQAAAADRVVVMEHGWIVQAGSHEDLVAGGGRYGELWSAWSAHRQSEASD
jgi:ATP-binding cassette subfamily C protein